MFVKEIGVDLGSSSVSMYVRGRGIVLREPSLAVVDRASGELKAVGSDAEALLSRSAGSLAAIRPVRCGVITNAGMAERMIRAYLKKVLGGSPLKPDLLLCIPAGISEVSERTAKDTGMQAGARRVRLMQTPAAAALGAGLDIRRAAGSMVVDIGHGVCHAAVLALGSVVAFTTSLAAGEHFDAALMRWLRRKKNLLIGERSAEEIKRAIGCVLPREEPLSLPVRGRDLSSGFPRTCEITSVETQEAFLGTAEELIEAIRLVLEQTPPELVSDITRDGIRLTGGGSLLYGIDRLITEKTGIYAYVAEDAADCTVLGLGAALEKGSAAPGSEPHLLRRKLSKA